MSLPRMLVLDHTAQEGGAELALVRLSRQLNAIGGDVSVLLFADGPLRARLKETGVRTAVLPLDTNVATASRHEILVLRRLLRTVATAVRFVPRLVRTIRGSRADIVVANTLKSAVFATLAAPLSGRPWVWHIHDRIAPDYLPHLVVFGLRFLAAVAPRAIIVNSQATLFTLPKLARRRATIAYPGLPAEAFMQALPFVPPAVGIVGRLSPTKGQREFIRAAVTVSADFPDLRFRVVGGALFGEGAYESEVRALAARTGIADRIEFTGWVANAAVHVRDLTLLVHASPVPEPFGQVVVEAMAAGVPVIATAAGGVSEILDESSVGRELPSEGWRETPTGVLVRPGDADALAAAIGAALVDHDGRARRAIAARKDAEARFTIEHTAEVVAGVMCAAAKPRAIR